MFFTLALASALCDIHPVYALDAVTRTVTVRKRGTLYRASAAVSFRVREIHPATILSVEQGVIEHARGHAIIAQRVAASADAVQADGRSPVAARRALDRAVRRLASDRNAELLREERSYDDITENGAAQDQGPAYGLPGGPNVQDAACTR